MLILSFIFTVNPLYLYLDEVAKRDPGPCKHDCVTDCYDTACGSYNHRSGTCNKAGYTCCEWVSYCEKDEAQDPGKVMVMLNQQQHLNIIKKKKCV